MNKKYIIGLVLLAILAGSAYFFKNRCEQPTKEQVKTTVLKCYLITLNKAANTSRDEICGFLKRGSECELSESDRPDIEGMFSNMFKKCVDEDLSSQKLCTDKLEL